VTLPDGAAAGDGPSTPEPTPRGEGAPSSASPQRLRLARVAVSWAFLCQGVCFAALVTRIPVIKDRFLLTDGDLAILLAVVPVIAGLGSLAAGSAAARYGSRTVLRAVGPVVPLSLIAVGFAGDLTLLVAALVFVGVGLGGVDATMNMQGVSLQTRMGRSVMASFYAVFSLAGILGAGIGAAAAALGVGLGAMFVVIALVLVPGQVWVGRWLLHHDVAPADVASREVPWRPVLLIGVAVTAVYILDSSVSNWSAVLLNDGLGTTETVAALGYAAYAATTLLGRALGDRQLRRRDPVRVVRLSSVAAMASLALVGLAPNGWLALVGFAALGLAICLVLPLAFVAADAHDPSDTGVAVARVNVFNYVGFVLGAPLVGLLAESTGLRAAFLALVPIAALLLWLAPRFSVAGPAAGTRSGVTPAG
jgi:MFS family permease